MSAKTLRTRLGTALQAQQRWHHLLRRCRDGTPSDQQVGDSQGARGREAAARDCIAVVCCFEHNVERRVKSDGQLLSAKGFRYKGMLNSAPTVNQRGVISKRRLPVVLWNEILIVDVAEV